MSNENAETSAGPSNADGFYNHSFEEYMGQLSTNKAMTSINIVLAKLEKGNDFERYPGWPDIVFPIPFADPNSKAQECWAQCFSFLTEVKLETGYRLGKTAQIFAQMDPKKMLDILKAQPGRWEWIHNWMELFDAVLNLPGVETDSVARKVCADVLEKLDSLKEDAPESLKDPYRQKFAPQEMPSESIEGFSGEAKKAPSDFCLGVKYRTLGAEWEALKNKRKRNYRWKQ